MWIIRGILVALAIPAMTISVTAAQPPDRGDTPGLGWGPGGSKKAIGAPAPVAGLGLPIIVAVGGFLWIRRKRAVKR